MNFKNTISLSSVVLYGFGIVWIVVVMPDLDNNRLIVSFIVAILVLYLSLDIIDNRVIKVKNGNLFKTILVGLLLTVVLLVPTFSNMYRRTQPDVRVAKTVHDGALQTEEAAKYLLAGKNFYTEDYRNTPLKEWAGGFIKKGGTTLPNPALDHFIYLPFYVLASTPFYALFDWLFSWYDQRIVLIIALIAVIFLFFKIGGLQEKTLVAISLAFLNPIFSFNFAEGYNDIFVILWLTLAVYLLSKRKYLLASVIYALACLSKQTAWLLLPFYWMYVYYKETTGDCNMLDRIKATGKQIYPLFLVGLIVILPFVIWDVRSFWQDIFLYPSGKLATSYPISGCGFSMMLLSLGWGVKSIFDYFPFWIGQTILGGLTLFLFYKIINIKNLSLAIMLAGYALFLFVFLFFSRFFHINYLTFIITIFTLAYLVKDQKNQVNTFFE